MRTGSKKARRPLPSRLSCFSSTWRSVRQTLFDDGVLHRLLQLLEGAHLDLAHAFARDAVTLAEFLQRGRLVLQAPLAQDVALALVQVLHRVVEKILTLAQLFALRQHSLLRFGIVDQPVLPLAFRVAA